jgi:hypothetical protein
MMGLLTDEERRLLRGRFQALAALEPRRQAVVREEIRKIRQLPPRERRDYLGSDETKQRFSPEELQLLYEVAGMPDER